MNESIVIPAEYLDTILDALNCERRQYQELTIDCPDPYYAEKMEEIDAALAALDQARQAQAQVYSHRNGEMTRPEIDGWYWIKYRSLSKRDNSVRWGILFCPDGRWTWPLLVEILAIYGPIPQPRKQAQPSAPSRAVAVPSWEPMHEDDSATLRRNVPAIDALYQQGYAVYQLQPAAPSVRAEPVPDWADAPEWANFWAVDDNGRSYWYEYKPTLGIRIWLAERGNNEISKQYPGWRNTLQARPRVEGQD